MTSTVAFPKASTTTVGSKSTVTDMSVTSVSRHATAVEVCDFVYGNSETATSLDSIERFYETNASNYENPFVTATSRSVISDIYTLTRQLHKVDVPKPLAMLCTLFRVKPPDILLGKQRSGDDYWFQALRVWTEVGEISESESFDGHRRNVVEHTLNVLLLPGVHRDRYTHHHQATSSDSLPYDVSLYSASHPHHPAHPSLPVPGLGFGLPSPLHLQLHIITRLSFNEQGRITHHRDFWDVKDVLGLVPGASLAQWIAARLAARGLSLAARCFRKGSARVSHGTDDAQPVDLESARAPAELTPAAAYGAYAKNVLGLHGGPSAGRADGEV